MKLKRNLSKKKRGLFDVDLEINLGLNLSINYDLEIGLKLRSELSYEISSYWRNLSFRLSPTISDTPKGVPLSCNFNTKIRRGNVSKSSQNPDFSLFWPNWTYFDEIGDKMRSRNDLKMMTQIDVQIDVKIDPKMIIKLNLN